MKTLVTGATGFLGSVLVRQLVDRGEHVRILRRSTSKLDLLGPVAEKVEHAIGDVTNPDHMLEAMDGIQRVYHTAAKIGFGTSREHKQLFHVNVKGTAYVVNAALYAGVERLVHTSSVAALGRTEDPTPIIDETAQWTSSKANTAYANSKHEAELEIYRGIAEGLDAVIVNPSLIFGPGRSGENTMVIVEKIKKQRFPFVPKGGINVVDVEDVAAGHLLAMAKGETGERYFLGSEDLAWSDLLPILAQALNVPPPKRKLSPKLAALAGGISEGFAFLTGIRPMLTRESARLAAQFYRYSNKKSY